MWPPKLKNVAPKSVITRMGQGFLQAAAFPLQFEFLFDFPGPLGETVVEGLNPIEKTLMGLELTASKGVEGALGAVEAAGSATDGSRAA